MKKVWIMVLLSVLVIGNLACSTKIKRSGNGDVSVRTYDRAVAAEAIDDENDYVLGPRVAKVIEENSQATVVTPGFTYIGDGSDGDQSGIFENYAEFDIKVTFVGPLPSKEKYSVVIPAKSFARLNLSPGKYDYSVERQVHRKNILLIASADAIINRKGADRHSRLANQDVDFVYWYKP
ncbi:MAG: hypothetical protein GF365_01785 [Candidatus Buchananbacteria bacterium]|nr:hypothetical protein [Candidatus Buchananbacteria bacterium]